MATKSKTRKKSVVRGKAAKATTKKAKRTVRAKKRVKAKKPAATTAKVTKKATVVKAVVATAVARKKPVARKAPAVSEKRSPSPRIVRAAMTVKQIPRAQQSYAVKPKPVAAAIEPVVELAVPELAVTTSVQGEVPAGGE